MSELKIYDANYDLGFTADDGKLAGGAAILAAATGNAVNGTALSGAAYGLDVPMERFTCRVAGELIQGMFHKVGFKDGENIEFVVRIQDEGTIVAAARNAATRFIWVEPYKVRGHRAQLRHDVIWTALLSFVPVTAFMAYIYRDFAFKPHGFEILSSAGIILLVLSILINFLVRRRFFSASYKATEIFAALGYQDPANVDLQKGLAKAELDWANQNRASPALAGKWQFRY